MRIEAINTGTASIQVNIQMFMPSSEQIPKHIEVFDGSLSVIKDFWIEEKDFVLDRLAAGMYMIRLSLSSGAQKDLNIKLEEGEHVQKPLDISGYSPHESHEWAYFNKGFTAESFRGRDLKMVTLQEGRLRYVKATLWTNHNGQWTSQPVPELQDSPVAGDGHVLDMHTKRELSMLEISGKDMQKLYVNLPPASNIKCLVKLSEGPEEFIHPIDVTVSTDNLKAETILALLSSGSIREAKKLTNAKEAEQLLQEKMADPVAAAIGGYFLLKTNELARMHDWARNLYNLFEFLPDGAVIYACQLMTEKDKASGNISRIRECLLEAVNRGLPVYTEGLRLLYENLNILWHHNKKGDSKVGEALKKLRPYIEVYDCSQETTTYPGTAPDKPGISTKRKKVVEAADIFRNDDRAAGSELAGLVPA